jgi:hypothetical protein
LKVEAPAQSSFDFGPGFSASTGPNVPAVGPKAGKRERALSITTPVEVLDPVEVEWLRSVPQPEEVTGSKHTHVYSLYLRSHDMMMRAVMAFCICAGLIVLIKGGVPLQEVRLGTIKFDQANSYFVGLLGLLSIAAGGVAVCYALRSWDLLRLAGVPLRGTATPLSKVLSTLGVLILAVAFASAMQFSYKEMYALVRLIFFNAVVYPDGIGGWRTE